MSTFLVQCHHQAEHLAHLSKENLPEASHFIKDNFYVDNGVTSVSSEEKAIDLIRTPTQVCREGGLRLCKFSSNSWQVMDAIPYQTLRDLSVPPHKR